AGYAEQLGWKAAVELDEKIKLPTRLEPTIYRLIQESLNNIAKHAGAHCIWVSLSTSQDNAQYRLVIRDDGQGFNPEATPNHGLGLIQMQARAEAANGTLTITSDPETGTTIEACLPIMEGRTR
ncbi:MAG: sensor histidine kinase, partial [Anaerolineae bacterium]